MKKERNHMTTPCDLRNFKNAILAAVGEVLNPFLTHIMPDVPKISPGGYGRMATSSSFTHVKTASAVTQYQ